MNILDSRIARPIALILVLFLACPLGAMASDPALWPQQQAESTAATQSQQEVATQTNNGVPSAASTPRTPLEVTSTAINAPQAQQSQQAADFQNNQTVPAGTAAAPYEKQEGISASKPAGAAIAPAKQRHIHSFAIRVGLLVGAAVAVGVITAVSLSSPGRSQ